MKSLWRSVPILVAMCVPAWPLEAADGILIVEKTTTANGPVQTHQVQIEKDWIRVDQDTASGEKQAFLFDGAKEVIWIVNYDKKTYTEMTKADLDRTSQQLTDALARVQEQMKNLPPEQQARMEEMLKSRGMAGSASSPRVTYRRAGTDRVGRWTCDKYEGYQNNQKMSEICTVDPQALGFVAADFEVSRKLAEFFKHLVPQNADTVFSIGKGEDQGFSGVPVRRVFFVGPRQSVTELTEASRQNFPASMFEVPAGFRKQPFGGRLP